ncbi:leukocyte elastase inhibitor-like [Gigantopelta aegis]|uniref:leukocyte elastase inhibitor-like n=1 Tax=Gigantopelta aegis TaxID=1735272 RepID=UPI001B88A53E|nr:leukocyte elastase inhibitor-like [Gigantopelta aegis]
MTLCSYIVIFVFHHLSPTAMADKFFQDDASISQLANANTQFTLDLYKKVANSADNIFLSPISISAALAMTRLGARGNTESEMDQVMKWTTFGDKVHDAFEDYLKVLNAAESSYTLTIANRIFVYNKLKLLDEFVRKTGKHYKSHTVLADFAGNPDGEKKVINEWVEKQTNGKIRDIIPGSIDPLTRLILVNAIYFKGKWEQKFDPVDTVRESFKTSSGADVIVDMMKMVKKFRIGRSEKLQCQVLELPYVQKDISMFILLPFERDAVSRLEHNLNNENLKAALSEIWKETVDITLPKFVLESNFALEKILPSMGMVDAFDRSRANFSGMAGSTDLYISHITHKAFLDVNEEGSEAAAATGVRIQTRSLPIIHPFIADHPFVFLVRDNRADIILFVGKLGHPPAVPVGLKQEL